jgi:predicted Fe-Mo cluster-binding NifX family protein
MLRALFGSVRLAIPQHQGRVSPVFDVAASVLLVDIESGQELRREERSLNRPDFPARAAEFLDLGARVLICGAISAPLEAMLISSGVRVIPFLCGPVDEVLVAFRQGRLFKPELRMPGCGRRRRFGWAGSLAMPGGFGGRRGRGAGGGGRCRIGGRSATGPSTFCLCPGCGERVPHTVGQPCHQIACPKCGTKMTRE